VIGEGNGFTRAILVVMQPETLEKVMTDVPKETPVITPEEEPTVITLIFELVQVPLSDSLSTEEVPGQTCNNPEMGGGRESIVTILVPTQPVGKE
jgi:hypothetical protein